VLYLCPLFLRIYFILRIFIVLLQGETGALLQREVSMQCADEKPSDAGTNREDYVHVRAKRGQATNSHSLAERVTFFTWTT
jgi:hypothetical protein